MAAKGARRADALSALEERIGWRFRDPPLLEEAMRHASVIGERSDVKSNERLEFLGDRVLNLIIADHLFREAPDADQGGLAQRINLLIDRTACARAARRADLGAALTLSKSEEMHGGRDKETLLADACEALIAALYLDGDFPAARAFVFRFWGDELEGAERKAKRDAKSALHEWAAAEKKDLQYHVVGRTGPEHAPLFVVEAQMDGAKPARGEGGSKREAEQAAAEAMLKRLNADG